MRKTNRYHDFRFATPDDFGETQFIPGFTVNRQSKLIVDQDTRSDALLLYRERLIHLEEIHEVTQDVSNMLDWHYFSKRQIETVRFRINKLQEED